jgi:hypothetical protein
MDKTQILDYMIAEKVKFYGWDGRLDSFQGGYITNITEIFGDKEEKIDYKGELFKITPDINKNRVLIENTKLNAQST